MSRINEEIDDDMEEGYRFKIIFMDRKQKSKLVCAWCGKRKELFGWVRDSKCNKEGVACESCIKAKF